MPIVEITLIEGRSKEQKRSLIKAVSDAVVSSIGSPPETVHLVLREVPPEHVGTGGKPAA